MPPAKHVPNVKSKANYTRAKDTTSFDVDILYELIKNIGPKHNDKLHFEVIYALVNSIAIVTQFLHLYKLNFYIYDFKLLIYSLLIISRRLLIVKIRDQRTKDPLGKSMMSYVLKGLLVLFVINIVYLIYQLLMDYSTSSIIVVLYYHIISILISYFLDQGVRYLTGPNEMNFIYKAVLFRTLEIFYFSWFLPFKCHDEHLSYDFILSLKIGFVAVINTTVLVFFFSVCYRSEELRKQSKSLGFWKRIEYNEANKQPVSEWNHNNAPYRDGVVVTLNKKYYKSICKVNASIPGDFHSKLLYYIFHRHTQTRHVIIIFMCFNIAFQSLFSFYSFQGITTILTILNSFIVMYYIVRLNRRLERFVP